MADQRQATWQNRAQLLGIFARMMRRILLDHAGARFAEKRGGKEAVRITLWLEPAGSKQLTTTTESSEASLVFQTVARLNLASTTQQSSSDGGDSGQKPDDRSKEAAPGQGDQQ